ncbi:MAG: NADH-quinone oxidoreductase subunit C [Acidobacteria bacterium]|nr:NADH-quinone oxidoreductase subunit C [Acidobacteriota bacterium]
MAATPWEDDFTGRVRARFGEAVREFASYAGQNFMLVRDSEVPSLIEYLRDYEGFDYLVDITAVDYPDREERFELIYILYSFERNLRVRVKTRVREGERPRSVTHLYTGANWLEREVFDMFGIEFAGHPDLRRILLPEEWRGHPLRKDYSIVQMDNEWVRENLGIESGQ